MQFDACCMECLVRRQYQLAARHGDGAKSYAYLRDVLQAILDAPAGVAAPYLTGSFAKAYQTYWPGEDAYAQLKRESQRPGALAAAGDPGPGGGPPETP